MPYGFNEDKSKYELLNRTDLRNAVSYKAGDILSGSCRCAGLVTHSSESVRFTIPLSFPIASGVTIGIPDPLGEPDPDKICSWTVRQNGVYLFGSGDGNAAFRPTPVLDNPPWSVSVRRSPSGLNVDYTQSGAIPHATNNAEASIQFHYYFILT